MKILFLTSSLPHPGVAGGLVVAYERIRRLAERGHSVGLLTFTPGPQLLGREKALEPLLCELQTSPPPVPASWLRRTSRLVASSIPPYFSDLHSPDMLRRVGDVVDAGGYHAVIAEFSAMGQYLFRNPYLPAVRRIISCHYSMVTSYRDMSSVFNFSRRGLQTRLSLKGLLQYEIEMYRSADRVLVFTARDRLGLLGYSPDLRITTIPCGVDTQHIHPAVPPKKEPCVLFSGNMHVESNRDAAEWLASQIWPLIHARRPDLQLYIVGPGAPPELRALSDRDPSIVVTGEVPDLRPHLQRAMVYISPVRRGSGIRVKILEAMAAGLPVVTTSLAAEGIPIQSGDNALVADRPEAMAQYVLLLMDDDFLRRRISEQARALAVEKFSWTHSIDKLEVAMADSLKD